MELSYTTGARDYMALLQHHLEGSALGKQFVYFAWIAIAALAWMSVLLPFLKFGVIDLGFVTRAAFAAALTFGFPFLYRWYNESVFGQLINERSVEGIAGSTVLVANEEFIEQRTKMTTARALWRDVRAVVSTPHHDFISLAPLVTIGASDGIRPTGGEACLPSANRTLARVSATSFRELSWPERMAWTRRSSCRACNHAALKAALAGNVQERSGWPPTGAYFAPRRILSAPSRDRPRWRRLRPR